eukprot:tig00020911_g15770.t1
MSRKNVGSRQATNAILAESPVPTETQRIARIISARGSNLYEVEHLAPGAAADAPMAKAMCRMPSKFKNRVWIKIGDYIIIEPDESGTKSDGVSVLYPDHIKHLQSLNLWPASFPPTKLPRRSPPPEPSPSAMRALTDEDEDEDEDGDEEEGGSDEEDEESEDDLPPNPNHVGVAAESDEETPSKTHAPARGPNR